MSETIKRTEARPARGESRAERPQRVPINGERDVITAHGIRPGFHPCWVNESNVPRFQAAGYTFVDYEGVTFGSYHVQQSNPLGARYCRNMGGGVYGYLMEVPLEYYNADREAEQKDLDKKMEAMSREARNEGLDQGNITITRS
jgi:hypothetical protein